MMITVQLTDDEISALRNACAVTTSRFEANLALLAGEPPGAMRDAATVIFTEQLTAIRKLHVKLIEADRVIIETDPEDPTDG